MLESIRKEGRVYQISDTIIVKEYPEGHLLEYEYRVGLKLNELNHPNLITTYDLVMEGEIGKLYLEYFPGQTMTTYPINRLLIRQVIYIILDIQSRINFTHYDLHTDNILIRMTEPRNYRYQIQGEEIEFSSPYQIKIIDYGSTHVPGIKVKSRICHLNNLYTGMMVEIFDPLYDIIFFSLSMNEKIPFLTPEIINKMRKSRFNTQSTEEEIECQLQYREKLSLCNKVAIGNFIDNNLPVLGYYPKYSWREIKDKLTDLNYRSYFLIFHFRDGETFTEMYDRMKFNSDWIKTLHLYLHELQLLLLSYKHYTVTHRPYSETIISEILQIL